MNGWRSLSHDVVAARGVSTLLGRSARVKESDGPLRPPRASGRPLLCLSDIHGDLGALESVLAAVKHLDLCGIVVAGDHCVGGSQPFEVYTRLVSLGAHLARGPSDLALGALAAGIVDPTPTTAIEDARLVQFLRTKKALGDVVCRRLADLPSTLVVSLDDTSGVMAMHGSPADDSRGLVDDDTLADQVACVAEDVLVTGATHEPFARAIDRIDEPSTDVGDDGAFDAERSAAELFFAERPTDLALPRPTLPLLVVNCGSVGMSPTRRKDRRRTAHAVLVAPCDDGRVHAWGNDILIVARARARSVG